MCDSDGLRVVFDQPHGVRHRIALFLQNYRCFRH
jgi:hypothetical protein